MKCPKCDYLGFETGDRCKNCGYDFSLLADAAPSSGDRDLPLRQAVEHTPSTDLWLNDLDASLAPGARRAASGAPIRDDFFDISLTPETVARIVPDSPLGDGPGPDLDAIDEVPAIDIRSDAVREPEAEPAPVAVPLAKPVEAPGPATAAAAAATWPEAALPLFTPSEDDEDAPLITLPATPRPPLAVRRTPDPSRLRAVPRPLPRPEPEPALMFPEEAAVDPPSAAAPETDVRAASRVWRGPAPSGEPAGAPRRLMAAAIDYVILVAIDLVVVYFTLRMAALGMSDWALLPPVPLGAFLLLIKLSYFCAFTAIGGQTIGKMAARIRVVTDEHSELTGAQAVQRTLAGVVSALLLGIGFLPGLFGDRRALHDRAARTRVVGLESA